MVFISLINVFQFVIQPTHDYHLLSSFRIAFLTNSLTLCDSPFFIFSCISAKSSKSIDTHFATIISNHHFIVLQDDIKLIPNKYY